MSQTKLDDRTEDQKKFTDFITERPLDLKLRRMTRKVLNAIRTRKARKQ